jgi:hypothetical protein
MPRISKRARFLQSLRSILKNRIKARAIRTIEDDEDSCEDCLDTVAAMALKNANNKRFLLLPFKKVQERTIGKSLQDGSR